jgi:REP element-mobilizing transposase RayT
MVDRRLPPEITESLAGRWEPVYRSQLHYLVTWGTRGRRPVLKDRHVRMLQEMVHQLCDERGLGLVEVVAGNDHVHVLIAIRPSQSIASVVRELKGRTANALLVEFPELRVWLRGNLVWDERYSVETVSAVRLDRVQTRLRSLHQVDGDLARAS